MFSGRLSSTITFRPKCAPLPWLYKAYSTGTQASSCSDNLARNGTQASTSSSPQASTSSSPPESARGYQPTRLFVAKIHKSVTDSDIKAAFGDVAGIIRKRLNTGYAFVDFKTHADAHRVLQAHAEVPIVLRGTALRVEMSEQGVTPNHGERRYRSDHLLRSFLS
ncbi:hypothetical protein CYLTODRAFT_424228 [Cylindrobasidium torrendii FP15055 ss-10]|uniref:RRM domain-containing protein n=1 Tax=Cylindrobasidium torrendii FP15055 ss-10 TaxID=1314674 RepID=A0A0D7B7N3_9AGAR|nr:hypothetical protein CYLTODRAFT_424228 [Cylindrobasidium torrendii FP15055 ss-10]